MKRTLKCAIAAIGAAAIAVGTAVPASAVNFKTYITSNSGSCGNVGGANLDSLLKTVPSSQAPRILFRSQAITTRFRSPVITILVRSQSPPIQA